MTIWQFQQSISRRLMLWSGLSTGSGLSLATDQDPLLRAMGQEFAAWGAVDGLIAYGGALLSGRRQAQAADAHDPTVLQKEASNLRRLLWLNAGLDVLYMLGGVTLAQTRGRESRFWRGHGLGILVQGSFLLLFDLWHALRLPSSERVS